MLMLDCGEWRETMEIRKADIKDLPIIESLSKEFNFELNRDWKKLVSSKNSEMFILLLDEKIIGFTGLIYYEWNNTIQISNIFVHPDYRKKGYASKLINHLINKVKKTKYRCLIAEAPSLNSVLKLYQKLGFRKCGYNDRYYSNTGKEICVWMGFDLE